MTVEELNDIAARINQPQEGDLAAVVVEALRLQSYMMDFAEGDCEYGDYCPPFAGTRHGTCTPCQAREALGLTFQEILDR